MASESTDDTAQSRPSRAHITPEARSQGAADSPRDALYAAAAKNGMAGTMATSVYAVPSMISSPVTHPARSRIRPTLSLTALSVRASKAPKRDGDADVEAEESAGFTAVWTGLGALVT